MPFVNLINTFFGFVCHVSCLLWFETKNKIRCIDALKYAFTHRNLPYTEKNIKCTWKVSILLYNWVLCNQTLSCLHLYGDSPVSQAQPRINAYEILLQHDLLLIFSRQNRFAETHSHLQLSYHITDLILAAGNKPILCSMISMHYFTKNDIHNIFFIY